MVVGNALITTVLQTAGFRVEPNSRGFEQRKIMAPSLTKEGTDDFTGLRVQDDLTFERVLPHLPKSIRALAMTERGHGDASRP